jgi:hypothetical protein
MNYKIKITRENQAIVKRIADENGMNPKEFQFSEFQWYYIIKENEFWTNMLESDYPELTTEQFVQIFDKKEKLTYTESAKKEERITNAEIIKSMREPTEWQPKRGDRVLVWDNDEKLAEERIFLAEIKGSIFPIVTVTFDYENDFKKENEFETTGWKHMKPLPIEQPKETDFKTKIIELIEKRIDESIKEMKSSSDEYDFQDALAWKIANNECGNLLNQIKEL